jgi:putative phosphoribosyl transferase
MRFRNRIDAGRFLAQRLTNYARTPGVIVLALPRGGVPVAADVARELNAPLDVFLVRKLGVPGHSELAMGAIAEGGAMVLNEELITSLGIPRDAIDQVAARERVELERRERLYRGARRPPELRGRTIILIDDGLATGSTVEAAILALRSFAPARIVVAVPVGARESCDRIGLLADEVVCAETPAWFSAVGQWYEDFSETTDDEVRQLLAAAPASIRVPLNAERADSGEWLDGDLSVGPDAYAIVLFAHGSGSSRHSPRNQRVAESLQARQLGTLLIDLLTPAEEELDRRSSHLRFNIPMLAQRLVVVMDWLAAQPETRGLPIGLFGASTGAAAALVAAAERPGQVFGVVSRGGRPDLAGDALSRVTAPALLIVGDLDVPVVQMNTDAMTRMPGTVTLEIVPGATHLFEEPGALDHVAALAGDWFTRWVRPGSDPDKGDGNAVDADTDRS